MLHLLSCTGTVPQSKAYFGEGEGAIHLDSVECSGLENRLIECGMNHSDNSTSHSLDVGVKCQPGIYISHLIERFIMLLFYAQLLGHIEMVIIVWWEELTTGRVVWRYFSLDHGKPLMTLPGLMRMLMLYVNNYKALLEEVRDQHKICAILSIYITKVVGSKEFSSGSGSGMNYAMYNANYRSPDYVEIQCQQG